MGFRIREFATIRIFSKDITKSRNWYKSLFEQDPIEDTENFVSFKFAGINLDITLPDDKNPFSTGGCVGYWLVDDIDQVVKKAVARGGRLYRGPLKVSETQRLIVQVQDTCGNIIGFEQAL